MSHFDVQITDTIQGNQNFTLQSVRENTENNNFIC